MLYCVLFLLNSSLSYVRPIWISGLECLGEEVNITQCNKALPLGYAPSCTHAQDAGLRCATRKLLYYDVVICRGMYISQAK